jgi:hypothetical protein
LWHPLLALPLSLPRHFAGLALYTGLARVGAEAHLPKRGDDQAPEFIHDLLARRPLQLSDCLIQCIEGLCIEGLCPLSHDDKP